MTGINDYEGNLAGLTRITGKVSRRSDRNSSVFIRTRLLHSAGRDGSERVVADGFQG